MKSTNLHITISQFGFISNIRTTYNSGMICDKMFATQITVLCILLTTSLIVCVNVVFKPDKNDLTAEEVRKVLEREIIENVSSEFLPVGEVNLSDGIYEEG